jgi:hyperosmotically inducible protein
MRFTVALFQTKSLQEDIHMLARLMFVVPFVFALAAGPMLIAGERPTDALIIAEIQNKLYNAKVPQHGDVQVAFSNGIATLTGTVDSVGVKEAAERAAQKVDEVTQVIGQITVSAANVTDQQIVEKARKEIVTYPFYGIFDNLELRAENGALTVSGQVTDPFKKSDIGNFLAYVKGVSQLQNDLEVLPVSIYDDQLRLAVARAIYNDPFFIQYATTALPSIHIIVKNGNVTLEGVVISSLDKAMAGKDATFAATYFSLTNNLRVGG